MTAVFSRKVPFIPGSPVTMTTPPQIGEPRRSADPGRCRPWRAACRPHLVMDEGRAGPRRARRDPREAAGTSGSSERKNRRGQKRKERAEGGRRGRRSQGKGGMVFRDSPRPRPQAPGRPGEGARRRAGRTCLRGWANTSRDWVNTSRELGNEIPAQPPAGVFVLLPTGRREEREGVSRGRCPRRRRPPSARGSSRRRSSNPSRCPCRRTGHTAPARTGSRDRSPLRPPPRSA